MPRRLVLLPLIAAACTDPDPAEPAPQVTLDATGALFAAVKPDDGAWQVLTEDENGNFSFARPETPYALVYVCSTNPFLDVDVILAGPDDGDAWGDVCFNGAELEPLDVVSPFQASVHVGRALWTVPGSGDHLGPAGVMDIGMDTFTDPPNIAFVRDVEIDGPTTVSVDVGAFAEMFLSELEITGELGAGARSEPDLTLGHDTTMQIWGIPPVGTTGVWLAPPEMLRAGDRQVHLFISTSSGAGHWVEVDRGPGRSADPVAVTFSGEMQSATLASGGGVPSIDVVADGDWDVARAEVYGAPGPDGFLRWTLTAHPGWTAAHPIDGTVAFPDVTTADGWDSSWTLGATNTGWGVRLGNAGDGVIEGVQFYEPFDPN